MTPNINRGGYRVLEDAWAKDVKQGKQVYVAIVPTYDGSSKRPSSINVTYLVDRARRIRQFSNSAKENLVANEIGALLNEVGNILARDTSYPLDGTFLYVEADWGWVDMAIFKDLGDHLLWRDPMQGLADILLELWEAEVPEKRWASMQYRVEHGSFETVFTYTPLDPEVTTIERQAGILQQRYGNKQIV